MGSSLFLLLGNWYNIRMKKNMKTREEIENMSHEELVATVLKQQEESEELSNRVKLLESLVFGRKTEKASVVQSDTEQLSLEFNEAEAIAEPEEDVKEVITVKEHIRKARPAGKRAIDLSKLPHEVVVHSIPEEELLERFPDGYTRLPDEVYCNLERIPERFIVIEHHVEKYCGKKAGDFARAKHTLPLIPNSIAGASVVAGILNGKYVNAMPLYRIEQEFKRNDVDISRQTMANWVILCAERYLSLLYDRMREVLISRPIVQADETPLKVNKTEKKANKGVHSKSYMWVYLSQEEDRNPLVIYDFQETRHARHPKEFLANFKGVLVSDGYEAYHKLARESQGRIRNAGCWIHARRKFVDTLRSMGQGANISVAGSLASEAIDRIQRISEFKNSGDCAACEREVGAFFEWIKEHRTDVTSGSGTGQAFRYCIDQEAYLRTFMENSSIPMDNNAAERAIRPFTVGRKNWVMIDTVHGAKSSAIAYSIAETAKANNLHPYEYFKFLLEEIPQHMNDTTLEFLDDLLPWSDNIPPACKLSK